MCNVWMMRECWEAQCDGVSLCPVWGKTRGKLAQPNQTHAAFGTARHCGSSFSHSRFSCCLKTDGLTCTYARFLRDFGVGGSRDGRFNPAAERCADSLAGQGVSFLSLLRLLHLFSLCLRMPVLSSCCAFIPSRPPSDWLCSVSLRRSVPVLLYHPPSSGEWAALMRFD